MALLDETLLEKAYAVRNSQGFWIGIWHKRETAEHVMSKQIGKGDELFEVYAKRIDTNE